MRKEKIEEAEKHLAKIEEMLKEQGDISFLCEYLREKMAEIDSLRSKLILEVKEKLELRGKVQELEDVRDCELVADELRAEVENLNRRIQAYWEEDQGMRSELGWRYTQGDTWSSRRRH